MEIRDPIHGHIPIETNEKDILDSPVVQRLRSIKQLGFSELSFPGATHNRWIHSVGASHLAGKIFDNIFKDSEASLTFLKRIREAVKVATLLHDVGHGPLSHATEAVMPLLKELNLPSEVLGGDSKELERQANHEDYTIKFIVDSSLTEVIKKSFPDMSPFHVAALVDKKIPLSDDFFCHKNINYRPLLCQIVSSEMDADRLDYLVRDAYYCGANYGNIEASWLIANLTFHIEKGDMYLALNRRGLFAFDDLLLSRHHMHLMVYCHQKSLIFEEMLQKYLDNPSCEFSVPADIEKYAKCTDNSLFSCIQSSKDPWARRIAERRPYKMIYQAYTEDEKERCDEILKKVKARKIPSIYIESSMSLSKYGNGDKYDFPIYVVNQDDPQVPPYLIEKSTEIFQKYRKSRRFRRIYVEPNSYEDAKRLLFEPSSLFSEGLDSPSPTV